MSNSSTDSTLTDLDSEEYNRPPTPLNPPSPDLPISPSPSKTTKTTKVSRKRKSTVTSTKDTTTLVESTQTSIETIETKPKRQRKKKQVGPVMSLVPRVTSLLRIGAHVSAAKGVQNAIANSVHIGGNAFGVFLKNQRKWESPAFKEDDISAFREACVREKYDPTMDILPHGSYLVNLANPDKEKRTKAYECFVDELKRCEQLGIERHNFHPGTSADTQGGIKFIADCINAAHAETKSVKIVLENAAGSTNSIGSAFEDLRGIIDHVKARVGVCIDTCHAFAAGTLLSNLIDVGYDLRTEEAYNETWNQFDKIIGFKYLAGLHLNDSRSTLGSKRDLHANLGRGFLSLEPFRLLVNDVRMQSIPMILETPAPEQEIWAEEIKLLYWMVGRKSGDPEILAREKELQELGREDREKQLDAVKRKAEKAAKPPRKKKKVKDGESKSESELSDSDSEPENHMH